VCVAGPQPLVCEFPGVWGWVSHGECKCDKVSRYRSVDLEIGWGLEIWHAGVIDPIGKYWYKGFCSRNKVSFCPSPMLPSVPHIASAQGEAIEVPYRHISVYVKQYGFDVKNKDFSLLKLKEELKVTIENSKNQPCSFNILSKNNNVSNINNAIKVENVWTRRGSARTCSLRCTLTRSAPGRDTRSGQGALARRHTDGPLCAALLKTTVMCEA
jgi:hypothetical protein